MNKKIFNLCQKKKGSVLAFSLIILFMMMAIAASLSVSTVIGKKSAGGTDVSVQALQTSDSGVQLALRKINTELKNSNPGTILSVFPNCGAVVADESIGNVDTGNINTVGSYDLSFIDKSGVKLTCGGNVSEIALVKSIGRYNGTVRLIDVAVDSGCPPTVKDNDGNTYQTVFIGGLITSQCWMKENLRTTKKPDGSNLSEGFDVYSDKLGPGTSNSKWGRLYNWRTAMNLHIAAVASGEKIRGICPIGWHIPSNFDANDDIGVLISNLGGNSAAGGALKVTGSGLLPVAYWNAPNIGGDDAGFSAVGAGQFVSSIASMADAGNIAAFWQSTEVDFASAQYFGAGNSTSNFLKNPTPKDNGLSVRCIKD
jgi:uncharacterized protein (TIGR02145 family)